MAEEKDFITVMIKSFVPPDEPIEGFQPGEPFKFQLPQKTRLGELVQKIYSRKMNRIGIMAINGEIASPNIILSQGDKIDLYALLDGG